MMARNSISASRDGKGAVLNKLAQTPTQVMDPIPAEIT